EIYIPYPREDQKKHEGFFPARDTPFELTLPDGTVLSAKVCQQNDKAIMSNPNSALGKWLLRDVLDLPENKLIDYEMLWVFGIDSVVFTKIADLKYEIDFTDIGTYERFNNPDASVEEDYE
ncbi:MAG: hypothetical protein LUD72_08410, partial [Bacteroidales bacterium]|nr:hypothetical protein [Bacteroidales bacterium]